MTDCFLCVVTVDQVRSNMAHLVASRWRQEPVNLQLLHPTTHAERHQFQRLRRIWSDELSNGDIYICADDDCLLDAGFELGEALRILADHQDFGILSLWPSNAVIGRWTPEEGTAYEDEEVMEVVSVGGVRFCRKGLLPFWPEMPEKGYDMVHAMALREQGYRVGYFKDLKMNHLGEGFSTVWNTT